MIFLEEYSLTLSKVGIARCFPGWSWDQEESGIPDFDLWYALRGRGQMIVDGETFHVENGDCFLLRPDIRFHANTDPAAPITNFYCRFDFMDANGRRVEPAPDRLPELNHKITDQVFFNGLIQRALTCFDQKDTDATVHWIKSILWELIQRERDENMDVFSRQAMTIRELRKDIKLHPERRRSLRRTATKLGYSPEHFSRLFKKHSGVNYRECVNQARLGRAKQLLAASDCSIERVAELCGYCDIHTFSKQFKAKAGLTPTRYRRENA